MGIIKENRITTSKNKKKRKDNKKTNGWKNWREK